MTKRERKPHDDRRRQEICERLAGGESLARICRDEHMPSEPSVYRWLLKMPDFALAYEVARLRQGDRFADEVVEIADTPVIGTKTVKKANGVEIVEGDMIEHRRLQVDARKWAAGKLNGKYSDKVRNEVSGPGGAPIQTRRVELDEPLSFDCLTLDEMRAFRDLTRKVQSHNDMDGNWRKVATH